MTKDEADGAAAPVDVARRRVLALLLSAGPALALAACAGAVAVETFNLSALEDGIGVRRGDAQLVVMEPVATAPYSSDRIVVRATPASVAYLHGAQWSDQLPTLLQARLIQTLENGRVFRAVGRPGERLVARVSLNMEIRRFDIDIQSRQAVIEVSARLIDDAAGRALASRIFTSQAPAPSTAGPAAAAALDQAFAQLLRDIAVWAPRHV